MDIPKPNFIIIGSAKCGTTTLAAVLASHPECCFSHPKEVCFFNVDKNYEQGWEWYKKHFSHYTREKIIGEATPSYTAGWRSSVSAKRIYEFNPKMKLIYIVRHPYTKLISAWKMWFAIKELPLKSFKKIKKETIERADDSLEEFCNAALQGFGKYVRIIDDKYHHTYLDNFKFDYQLGQYRQVFPEDQIKVLFLEDWAKNPALECRKLCDFLNIDFDSLDRSTLSGSNKADQKTTHKKWLRVLSENRYLEPLRKLLPSKIKYAVGSAFGTDPIKYPKPEISPEYKKHIIDYIKDDAKTFLKRYGKPEDFWDFNNIQ